MVVLVLTVVTILTICFLFYRKLRSSSSSSSSLSSDSRKRAMSFSSLTLIRGSFPPATRVSPPIINILLIFKKCPDLTQAREITTRLLELFRFRSKPIYCKEMAKWIFHEINTNIEDHVIKRVLPNEKACYEYIETLSKQGFEHMTEKPAWIFHLIENTGDGKSFMLMRIHHVIGDGIALVLATDRIFTDENGNVVKTELPSGKNDQSKSNTSTRPKPSLLSDALSFISSFLRVITLPKSNYDSNLLFTSKNKTKLTMNIADQKIVYLPVISLDFVKQIKIKSNGTVNDVILSAMTGAIRRYCEKLADPVLSSSSPESIMLRALLPVSLPRAEKDLNDPYTCLQNKWCFVSVPLPIQPDSSAPEQRLSRAISVMNGIKKSYEAVIQFGIMNYILPYAPPFVIHETAQDSFSRHSLVFSNVPGPQKKMYFCGEEIIGLQAIFPNLITQSILLSYCGGIFGNLVIDKKVITKSDLFVEMYLEELQALGKFYEIDTKEMVMKID